MLAEEFYYVEFRNMKIGDEEQCRQCGENVVNDEHDVIRNEVSDEIEEGKDDRGACDGQTAVALGTAVLIHLAFDLQYVEECEADNGTKDVEDQNGNADDGIHAAEIKVDGRNDTEANDVTERIELNAEVFLVRRSVLFGTGNYTVKHIANAGKNETENCRTEVSVIRKFHAEDAGNEAHVGQNNCIIIKSDQFHVKYLS